MVNTSIVEVFTAVKIHVEVFWVLTTALQGVTYQKTSTWMINIIITT